MPEEGEAPSAPAKTKRKALKAGPGRPRSEEAKAAKLFVRLTPGEREAFTRLATEVGVPPSRLLRAMIRETLTERVTLLDKRAAFVEATNQVTRVGRNLNQILRAVNRGQVGIEPLAADELRAVLAAIDGLRDELDVAIRDARRWHKRLTRSE